MSTIKTWRERHGEMRGTGDWFASVTNRIDCMQQEIDELRAALSEMTTDFEIAKEGARNTVTKLRAELQIVTAERDVSMASADRAIAENERLRAALNALWTSAPETLECQHFHHRKSEQRHPPGECGPVQDYLKALSAARAALGEAK